MIHEMNRRSEKIHSDKFAKPIAGIMEELKKGGYTTPSPFAEKIEWVRQGTRPDVVSSDRTGCDPRRGLPGGVAHVP